MKSTAGHQLQVRGSAIFGRTNWVRVHHGDDGIAAVSREVSPAVRNALRGEIDRRAWYNYPLFIELAITVDRLFGAGDSKLNQEIARYNAHVSTPVLYAMFIRLGSVDWVLQRAARLWHEHFNAGGLRIEADGSGHGAVGEILEFPTPHLAHSYSVLGFAIGCVELSGEQAVRGSVVSCRSLGSDRTVLRVQWGDDAGAST